MFPELSRCDEDGTGGRGEWTMLVLRKSVFVGVLNKASFDGGEINDVENSLGN